MRLLVMWAIVLIPYTIFGVYTGDKYWSPSNVIAFAVTGAVLVHLFAYQRKLAWEVVWWHKYFLMFLVVGLGSTITSPYFTPALARAIFQFTGIVNMLGLCIALASEVRRDPEFLARLTKCTMIGLGIVAVLGIIQFVTFNALHTDAGFSQLLIFNDIAHGYVYKLPSELGSILRPNSICREPSHLAQFLGMGAGLSLLRLGVLGRIMQEGLRKAVPKWTAVATLVCFTLTVSVIAYLLLAMILVSLIAVSRRFNPAFLVKILVYLVFAGAMISAMAFFAGPKFTSKVSSLRLFFTEINPDDTKDEYVSALAITANIDVMVKNLKARPLMGVGFGAHPLSYIEKAPLYIRRPDTFRINSADAGGLIFRLLSETGLAGTFCYVAGMLAVCLRARRLVITAKAKRSDTVPLVTGYAAAFIGIAIIFFFRWGSYYDVELWTLMAILACAPMLFQPGQARIPVSEPMAPQPVNALGLA